MSASIVGAPPADEPLYEVVEGQRMELAPTSAYATWIASRLHTRLDQHAEGQGAGTVVTKMLFVLDEEADLRRRPDVAFVSADRWPLDREMPKTGDWRAAPDLAVEVVGPSDEFQAVLEKVHEYFRCGVRRVRVVSPEQRQVYICQSPTDVDILAESDCLEGGDVLMGFQAPVAGLFQRGGQTGTTEPA
jgi:Uma2 family endonuclease